MSKDLFISASAGTGKTHKISTKYLEIFDEAFGRGDPLSVGNVVAITFTRKAAAEMKDRIVQMMHEKSKEDSRWLNLLSTMPFAWIGTIDSFAGRILSETGPFVGLDPSFKIVTGPRFHSEVHRSVLRALWERDDLLNTVLEFFSLDDIVKAFSYGLEGERANLLSSRPALAVECEVALHHNRTLSEDLSRANEDFLALFWEANRSYDRRMGADGFMDFAGVLLALRQVLSSKNHSWLRTRLRRQFKYIIVDEFQDTDFLQKEILELLRGPETEMVYVGDAKQSIYRFRGAEVEVFSKAKDEVFADFGDGCLCSLDTNYRSHPKILEFCNLFYPEIFSGGDRPYCQSYEPVKPLPVKGKIVDEPRVKLLWGEDEAKDAAEFIQSMVGQKFDFLERKSDGSDVWLEVATRSVRYKDITILLRKMRGGQGERYMKALQSYEIPYYTLGESGFFELPEIAGLISLLKLIADPNDDLAMVSALMSPVVGLDLNDLAILKHQARSKDAKTSLFEVLALDRAAEVEDEDEDVEEIAEDVGNDWTSHLAPAKKERVERFRGLLSLLLELRSVLKPSDILGRAVSDLDYGSYLALEDSSGRKLSNLRKLIDASKDLDEPDLSLREMVNRLERFGSDDVELASVESEETDAVKIMTVHKAKGLEFPIVIVGDTSWSKPAGSEPFLLTRDAGEIIFSLAPKDPKPEPDTFIARMMAEEADRDFEEEKRTLYVATTRATDLLALTFSNSGRGSRPWREMLLNLVTPEKEVAELNPGFESAVELVQRSDFAPSTRREPKEEFVSFDLRWMAPVVPEISSERQSPTWLTESWEHRRSGEALERDLDSEGEESLEPKELGRLAHQILESLGVSGATLEDLGSFERPGRPNHLYSGRFSDEDLREVWTHLDSLKSHPLVGEIESSLDMRSEYEIIRPFGRYLLVGRPDKLIRGPEGWKIVDYKFADSLAHCPAYEFQMKFYIYLARDIFKPMLGADLFYLKGGEVRTVTLEDDEVSEFEAELRRRIERQEEKVKDR